MSAKKIISIYKNVIFALYKLELKQNKYDLPSLVYPFNINAIIEDVNSLHEYIQILNSQLSCIHEIDVSLERSYLKLFHISSDIRHLWDLLNDLINLCCCVLSNATLDNDCEKNLNTYFTKKVIFNGENITKIYKDIIKVLDVIQKRVLQKSLINTAAMIESIEAVDPDINLLSEGIAIVKAQRKFTYYDIVLIMNRFVCGLTRLLYITRDIQDAIDILNENIECEQKLIMCNK